MAEDTTMNDAPSDEAILSEDEQRVLELWDRLEQLQLQIALVNARKSHVQSSLGEVTEQVAQDRFLETRAAYLVRNQVVERFMAINPTMNAVHHAKDASPIERDLLAPLQQRDAESIETSKQARELHEIRKRLTTVESEGIKTTRSNVVLAAELLRLTEELSSRKNEALEGDREQIARLEHEMRLSRRKWRTMKGTASAVIAASGIDWAHDSVLRDIVLDPE